MQKRVNGKGPLTTATLETSKEQLEAPSQNLNPNLPDRSRSSTILNHLILLPPHHNHNLLLLILGPIILLLPRRNKLPRTPQQTIQPEQIQTLQHRQQRKSDDIRNPAFILLRFPVEVVGAYGAELGQQRPEDAQVQVVAEVDPGSDVEGVEGDDEVRVDVVEGFGDLKPRRKDIVSQRTQAGV